MIYYARAEKKTKRKKTDKQKEERKRDRARETDVSDSIVDIGNSFVFLLAIIYIFV
jgi:hypothetical protein